MHSASHCWHIGFSDVGAVARDDEDLEIRVRRGKVIGGSKHARALARVRTHAVRANNTLRNRNCHGMHGPAPDL